MDRKIILYIVSLSEARYEFYQNPPARGRDTEKLYIAIHVKFTQFSNILRRI